MEAERDVEKGKLEGDLPMRKYCVCVCVRVRGTGVSEKGPVRPSKASCVFP